VFGFVTAEGHDGCADHDYRQAVGCQWCQDLCGAQCAGHDQPHSTEEFDRSEGFDEAGAEVVDPSGAGGFGEFLSRDEQFGGARDEEFSGEQASDNPESEVHGILLVSYLDPFEPVISFDGTSRWKVTP
jgi:hypothetical protein